VITDSLGRICSGASNVINFHLSGPGEIVGESSQIAENGFVRVILKSQRQAGETILTAESAGLQSDSLIFQFKNFLVVDDFQSYASSSHLNSYWQIYTGTQIQPQLGSGEPDAANKFLRLDYQIGTPVYAGVFRHVSMDWSQFESLTFRVKADDTQRSLSVMFKDASGNIWSKEFALTGTDWVEHSIPFSEFKRYFGFGEMDLSAIVQVIFLIEKGNGEFGSGTIYIDDVKVLLETENTQVSEKTAPVPNDFQLLQNFPNPFNSRTEIRYHLPNQSDVELVLFNVLGEKVKTIIHENQSHGWYRVSFDANELASGVYLLQMRVGGFVRSRKVLVLK
ncbi:MAG: T9SS type A sorting domain-containing protein, partial [Calditrichaeota bacterium]|nr:T9SS type A sorting domain-containing protein [Calditrichota bacterium]